MSDYLKSTNFATKDALPSGNAGKIVKGTEIDNEFNAIADAVESKADLLNPVFSGLLTTDTLTTGGATNVGGTLAVTGATSLADDVQMTGTGRVLVPKGTTAQRPTSPASGSLRYNTTLGYLENYTGTVWLPVGYVVPADVSDKTNTSTGYFQVPVGTTAQRPGTPLEGLIRYNSEADIYEGYINTQWQRFLTVNQGSYSIDYVVIGGGGGGQGGGGGGSTLVVSTTSVIPASTVLTMTIGGGGATSTNGSSSTITGVATCSGGYAGTLNGTYPPASVTGGASPSGRTGGYNYRNAFGGSDGGGAGAGANGGDGGDGPSNNCAGGNGGAGLETLITGTSQYLAGGGGGGAQGPAGSGTHGGGNGNGGTGTANTGGGGGGGVAGAGSAGGSGVVYLKMPTVNYTGTHTGSPTISTTGSFTVLKYTGSGTYTC